MVMAGGDNSIEDTPQIRWLYLRVRGRLETVS